MHLEAIDFELGSESFNPVTLFDDHRLIEKTGINKVYLEESKTSDLVLRAATKVFDDIDREKIDVCILITQTPDDLLPANSIGISSSLNLRNDVIAFDVNQGCSGFAQALCIVNSMLCRYDSILLLTGDRYRSKLRKDDRATNSVFSDASTASIWTSQASLSILYEKHLTDGSKRDWLYQSNSSNNDNCFLHMSGAEVWMFTRKKVVPEIINAIDYCEKHNFEINQIYLHQASKVVVDGIVKLLPSNFSDLIPKNYNLYGNTVSSSIPILISENPMTQNQGKVNIICGFGVGLTCTTLVLGEINE